MRWEYCDVPDCEDDPATLGKYSEYKVTWTATRDPMSLTLQIGEIEVPGLLAEKPGMPILDYAGVYVSSVTRNICVCNEHGISQALIYVTTCSCIHITNEENCDSEAGCDWNPHSTHINLLDGHSDGVSTDQNALDHNTDEFSMNRDSLESSPGAFFKWQ